MCKNFKFIFVFLFLCSLVLTTSCSNSGTKTAKVTFYDEDKVLNTLDVNIGESVSPFTPTKEGYEFVGWYLNGEEFNFDTKINESISLIAKWELLETRALFEIKGNNEMVQHGNQKLNIEFTTEGDKPKFEWTCEDYSVVDFSQMNQNFARISAYKPGTTKVVLTGTYPDGSILTAKLEIVVTGIDFEISYVLNEYEQSILPSDAPTVYNTGVENFQLPVLEKENYIFLGWTIQGVEGVFRTIKIDDQIDANLTLTPSWVFPRLEAHFEDDKTVIGLEDTTTIVVNNYDILDGVLVDYKYVSLNEKVATVDENGVVTPVGEGYTEILVKISEEGIIYTSVGLTVTETIDGLNEVIKYFANIAQSQNIVKTIKVTGWHRVYKHELRTSVIGYLFEDLPITENIAPLSNSNRPGIVRQKYYITVHDTGDVDYSAKDWSDTVYNEFNEMTGQKYEASYNYVMDNKDVYHNIPDNEVSYHAGDGSQEYAEYATGVYGTNKYPEITITADGYYAIDGVKSSIVAPTNNGKILTTADINDAGIRCVIKEGQYYLGKTWYSSTYKKISNGGGNRNSIGIESCITEGDDIYYTWQRLAKLCAKLMDENNLTVDDIVPHHYFSGKHCPQTMREAGMWEHFKNLCQIEYDILQFIQAGYEVSFVSNNLEYVNNSGRVIKTSNSLQNVTYTITVSKDGYTHSITLGTNVMYTPFN